MPSLDALPYLSVKLIESHYENNYGGALRRLDGIAEQLESLDFANTPGHVLNGPEQLKEWIGELSKSEPVVVYCAYGFHVGCKTAIKLRDAGFDAKYMNRGHSGWKAIGAPTEMHT